MLCLSIETREDQRFAIWGGLNLAWSGLVEAKNYLLYRYRLSYLGFRGFHKTFL
jgi:hypothetical protein